MLEEDAYDIDTWASVAFRYQTANAENWRENTTKDCAREILHLLAIGREMAGTIIVSEPGNRPYV